MPFRLSIAKIGTILFFVIALAGCNAPHYLYAPTAENIPAFTGKNQSDIDIAISGRGADAQVAYAVSDHIAISGSWYFRNENNYYHDTSFSFEYPEDKEVSYDTLYYQRHLTDIGLSYFSAINKSNYLYWLVSVGGGIGNFEMKENSFNDQLYDSAIYSYHDYYNAKVVRLFIQPAIMYVNPWIKGIFSFRLSGIRYYSPQTSYDNNTLDDYGYNYINEHYSWFAEPAMTFKIFPNKWLSMNLQYGCTLPVHPLPFDYRFFIGNIGVGIDPIQLLQQHRK
jgi:hypothetical protein